MGWLDAFFDSHMDLVSVDPVFNLYNDDWPLRGESENLARAKLVDGGSAPMVVGAGSIISAASVLFVEQCGDRGRRREIVEGSAC